MKIEVQIPVIGESVTEATIGEWLVEEGAYVEQDATICLIESEKASMEIPAPESGQLSIKIQTGETVDIGTVIALIDTNAKPETSSVTSSAQDKKLDKPVEVKKTIALPHISHIAQQIIDNNNLNVNTITGTGPGGRITKTDANRYLEELQTKGKSISGPAKSEEVKIKFSRNERREKMSTLRQTISSHLLAAKNNTAMLTTINEADLSAVIALRKKYKETFLEKFGVRLGYMSFFTRAVCKALEEFPVVNARLEENQIVYHDYADISIAISSPRGLVVPVIRNAESKSLAQIEKDISVYSQKAKEGKLTLDEMSGGTFTITNGGVFGSLISTPIINTPQSAVLGMHTIQERPVARNGEVVIKPMMYISLSYDHRIIDGKESVNFLVRVKELLEDPDRFLLGL